MQNSKRKFLDYSSVNIPMSVLNTEQKPEKTGTEPTVGELWDAATYRNWVGESLYRSYKSETEGGNQEGYSVGMDDLMEYNDKGYSDEELKFFSGSTSPENFAYRQDQVKADRNAKVTLENSGVTGFAVETASAIFDPMMIPMMLFDAPEAAAVKFGKVGEIGFSMLRGASEGVLSEYLLKQGDTQRTDEDLYMSALGGMAFSGLIDIGKMTAKGASRAIERANVIEGTERDVLKESNKFKGYDRADKALSTEQKDPIARKTLLTDKDILDTLKKESGERVDVMSKKKVKAAKDEFRTYKKGRLAAIEKIKARPNMKPSAVKKEVQQVESAINNRQIELDNTISINKEGLNHNTNLDKLQQGVIPKELEQRRMELHAEKGEFDTKTSKSLGKDIKAGRVGKDATEDAEEEVAIQSVGAAKTRQQFEDISTHDELLTEPDVDNMRNALFDAEEFAQKVPRNSRFENSSIGGVLRSISSTINNAPTNALRGLGMFLLKDPQRTIAGHQSAEELADTLFHKSSIHYEDYTNAMGLYLKDEGIGKFNTGDINKASIEFERQTVTKQVSGTLLSNKPVDGDDAITLGAKARSRINEDSLKNYQDYDVVGFEKVKHRHEYHPIVYNASNIASNESNADNIYDAIAQAYVTGGIKVSRENAIRLAKNQVARAMAFGKTNKNFDSFMSEVEYKKLEEELLSNNVDRDVIDDIKQSIFDKEERGTISPRAMFSLRPNLKARSGDVWMVDLVDTSINRNMKYLSDSSASAGLASNGFHSRHQFQRAVASANSSAINDIRLDVKSLDGKAKKEAERVLADLISGKYLKLLDEGQRLMFKEPLEDHNGTKDITRLLRKTTTAIRLRTTGLMTIPEFAVAGLRNGIITSMKQIPSTRWFDYRETSITKDKFMDSFSRSFVMTGHQENLFGRKFYNGSDFDDMTKSKLSGIDKMLGHALDITMTVNLFKMFQHGGEEMVARSIVSNLKDMAIKGEITPNIRRSLIDVGGMSDEQVTKLISHMNEHKDLDVFDIVRQMEAKDHNTLSVAVRNTIGSSFMRLGIGEQPAYMNREMGKVMTSLLSFSIGSYEKMLLRGIKSERALLLSMLAGQSVLGYGSLVANTYVQAQGLKGRKRDEFIKKRLSDEALFWGVINRVGILAAPTLPLQALNSLNLLPESMKGAGNYSGIQSVEMAKDLANATSASLGLATKKQSQREKDKAYKTIKRVLPWYNSTLYNMTIGTATQ